jgi:flavoprotein
MHTAKVPGYIVPCDAADGRTNSHVLRDAASVPTCFDAVERARSSPIIG